MSAAGCPVDPAALHALAAAGLPAAAAAAELEALAGPWQGRPGGKGVHVRLLAGTGGDLGGGSAAAAVAAADADGPGAAVRAVPGRLSALSVP